ncbi:class I adenylate-forming enzyme family protein [Ferviditalea candida]|uniref:AMP-binding protein n=1 Tax=Ferviditalea candida TaxID=3108399 RepID=A0ABU5ZN89_9BACL|nr:AMP-binding protein [Paenibacillaceae bacterium T2]
MRSNEEVMTLPRLLEKAVQSNPDREAIYDRTRRLTYRQVLEESNRLADALTDRGIQKGDRVAVVLPNWHETVIIYFAVSKIGAILVPFNPKYRLHEVEHILKDCRPKLIFIGEEFDHFLGMGVIVPWIHDIVSVRFKKEGTTPFTELIARGGALSSVVELDPLHDDFCILYTSGTTGLPKGVVLTHYNLVTGARKVASGMKCTSEDVLIINIPLFHVFGMGSCLISAIISQMKIVLQDKYSPRGTLELIQSEKVTIRNAVPAMFLMELNQPDFGAYDLSSLRCGLIGGAPVPAELLKNIRLKMKMEILGGYGLTEVGTVAQTKYADQEKNILETIGQVLSGTEVKIVNDRRESVRFGVVGEIACKGFGIVKGYYNAHELTRQAFDGEGWFYTGDLGTLDDDGYIRFIGRKKEMIIRGGYNIYPQEIEEILYKHPKVLEAAVIGLPDEVMGEAVCAAIKLKPGVESTAEEILEHIKGKLADYKIPSHIFFVDDFPVTASGKIQKLKLQQEIIERLEG